MTVELTKEVDKEKPLPKALGDNRPMEEVIMERNHEIPSGRSPHLFLQQNDLHNRQFRINTGSQ